MAVHAFRLPLIVLLVFLFAVPSAEAGRRLVPTGFYGVMWDGPARHTPERVQRRQWDLMARAGVESVRTVFSWRRAQPREEDSFSFMETDAIVMRGVRRRIRILPVVIETPAWAASRVSPNSPPRDPEDYARFLRALIGRYGPRGSFWREHPELPRRPLREWQIWNEPPLRLYWNAPSGAADAWPRGYVRLLRAAKRAIRATDRHAKVVLAGLTNDSWNDLEALYRRGARAYFDVAAFQTYTSSTRFHLRGIRSFRRVMRRHGDDRKLLRVTEVSWPAAKGRTPAPRYLKRIATSDRGMARKLSRSYRELARVRRRYRIGSVHWYTWASPYKRGPQQVFEFSGLQAFDGERFRRKPALRAYAVSAQRHQGCRKTSSGRCRR